MFKQAMIILLVLIAGSVTAENKLEIGDVPPSYLGKDGDGNKLYLEDHKGKIVVISFWASWCTPCLKELPILESIQNKVGTDKIKVIAINFKEGRKKYRFIKKKLSSLNLTLTHDKRGSIGKKFGVESIPNLFIIGKNGKLIFHNVGYGDESLDKIIDVLNLQLSS
jgi:thiol-disulfide isomerase/thioredoxin